VEPLVHPNEIVDMVIALLAVPILLRIVRVRPHREALYFSLGYGFMLLALVATIAEGLIWPDLLNDVEHLCYAASGIAFLMAIIRIPGPPPHTERDAR
jgi:hypothetical protein